MNNNLEALRTFRSVLGFLKAYNIPIRDVMQYVYGKYNEQPPENQTDPESMLAQLYGSKQGQMLADTKNFLETSNYATRNITADDSSHSFQYFEKPAHTIITGNTGDGKTTALCLHIHKGIILVPKKVFLFQNSAASQMLEMYKDAIGYNYMVLQQKNETPLIYSFQDTAQQLEECFQAIRNLSSGEESLFIVEDCRAIKGAIELVTNFILVAKNKNCSVILIDHYSSQNKALQPNIRYRIMCNPSEATFNQLVCNSQKMKVQDPRYLKAKQMESGQTVFIITYDRKNNILFNPYGSKKIITNQIL